MASVDSYQQIQSGSKFLSDQSLYRFFFFFFFNVLKLCQRRGSGRKREGEDSRGGEKTGGDEEINGLQGLKYMFLIFLINLL